MTDAEILSQFGGSVVSEIIKQHIAAGQKVSGNFVRKLRSENDARRLQIVDGAGYGFALEAGRGPTKNKNGGGGESLVDRITQWVKGRGLKGTPYERKDGTLQDQDKADEGLVWAIVNSIHNKGTLIYQENRVTGVISDSINEKRVGILLDVFATKYKTQALSDLKKAFA